LLPNFICPGTQKSATKTLYYLLQQHPDIFLSDIKEILFFDDDKYSKGILCYEENIFNNVKNEYIQ